MKLTYLSAALCLAIGLAMPVNAERLDHYEGKSSETLEQALANFSEYNAKLAAIMEKPELTPVDLNEIHQLTYTLENALEKINTDLAELAETLEALHQASETGNVRGTRESGKQYIKDAKAFGL